MTRDRMSRGRVARVGWHGPRAMNVIAVSRKCSSTASGSRALMIPTPLKKASMIIATCFAGSSVSMPHLSSRTR